MKMTQLAAVVAGAFLALAASQTPARADENAAKGDRGDRTQRRVEMMKERLNLTDDQVRQIEQILRDAHQQGETDREAMKERHKKIHEQIESVLTPEQREKHEQMRKEHCGGRGRWKHDKEKSTTTPSNPQS